ncbi:MAG: biotin transporter BioY [Candidatus Coatesbacteria bacterium]|nr:biotin transporter BioY [Candidatus Coatesbacteria bacterium]
MKEVDILYDGNILHLEKNKKIVYCVIFSLLTGVSSNFKIYIPGLVVPITLQTMIVLLSGVYLGRFYGGLSQLFYILLGISGLPLFATQYSGLANLAGPTGGYLIGFVFASFLVGNFIDNYPDISFKKLILIFGAANFFIIHLLGLLQLSLWYRLNMNLDLNIIEILKMGSIPFIPGDIIKIFFAILLAIPVIKKRYNLTKVNKSSTK